MKWVGLWAGGCLVVEGWNKYGRMAVLWWRDGISKEIGLQMTVKNDFCSFRHICRFSCTLWTINLRYK